MPQLACQQFIFPEQVVDAECGCALDAVADADLIDAVIDAASDVLYLLSGQRITGVCRRTVVPIGDGGICLPRGFWDHVYSEGQTIRYGVPVIPLRGPRTVIVEVMVDGVVLGPGDYGLIDDSYLFRTDGTAWPSGSVLDETKFHIVYEFNRPPDFITEQAAIELSCQWAARALGAKSYLPEGTTSADIQGASVKIKEQAEAGEGLPKTAQFLSAYGAEPGATTRHRSGVWSPDLSESWNLVEVEGPSGS